MSDRVGWRRQPEFPQGVANFSAPSTTQARREHLTMLRALGFAALFAAYALQGGCTDTRGPSTPAGARAVRGARSFARERSPG